MNQLIIFSKNRPCQLHLTLESFKRNNTFFDNVRVLYTYTPPFKESYITLEKRFPYVEFIKEFNFKQQVISLLSDNFVYTSFCVDDAVLYRKMGEVLITDTMLCFSLRLGLNNSYCYPMNQYYTLSQYTTNNNIVEFIPSEQQGDFGYPLSTDGHIFRTETLKTMLCNVDFREPNTMEASWQSMLSSYNNMKISCFKESCLVSIPINRVNNTMPNRYGEVHGITEEKLNEMYMLGEIIDFDGLDFSNIIGAHQEIKYVFRSYND